MVTEYLVSVQYPAARHSKQQDAKIDELMGQRNEGGSVTGKHRSLRYYFADPARQQEALKRVVDVDSLAITTSEEVYASRR